MEEGKGKKEKGIDRRERYRDIDVGRDVDSYNYSVVGVYMIEAVMVVVRCETGQTTITSTSEWLIKYVFVYPACRAPRYRGRVT